MYRTVSPWKTVALCSISAVAGMMFVVACGDGPRPAAGGGGAGETQLTVYTGTCEGVAEGWTPVPSLQIDMVSAPMITLWQRMEGSEGAEWWNMGQATIVSVRENEEVYVGCDNIPEEFRLVVSS